MATARSMGEVHEVARGLASQRRFFKGVMRTGFHRLRRWRGVTTCVRVVRLSIWGPVAATGQRYFRVVAALFTPTILSLPMLPITFRSHGSRVTYLPGTR